MRRLESLLLVEDEPDIAAVMRLALEELGGFRVTVCASGEAALATISEKAYDLLLLDVMLPGMDGMTVLQRLRARPEVAEIPVVFITARVRPGEEQRLRALGAVEVISKPFDPMSLPDRVRVIWDGLQRGTDHPIAGT